MNPHRFLLSSALGVGLTLALLATMSLSSEMAQAASKTPLKKGTYRVAAEANGGMIGYR